MTNRVSSFPAHNDPAPLHRHAGRIAAQSELPINAIGDDYTLEGNGIVRSLPALPSGTTFTFKTLGTPTFINSSKLICQGGSDYLAAVGDLIIARSDGDGAWRIYVLRSTSSVIPVFAPMGRLTLTSGAPVMAASVSAATNIYYTPAIGEYVPIFDGTTVAPTAFSELTIALGSNWAANSNYDVFVINDSGTIRAVTGPAWTSDTARGTSTGTTELVRIKGLWFNAQSITGRYTNSATVAVAAQRGTYVGSFRTAATGQVNFAFPGASAGGTAGLISIFNNYNRTQFAGTVSDTTSTWTYGAGGQWRAANGSASARVSMLRGFDDMPVIADYNCIAQAGSGGTAASGIGLNSTTVYSGRNTLTGISTNSVALPASYAGLAGLGFTYVAPLEYMTAAVATFVGSAGTGYTQTGLQVQLWY